VHSAAQKIEQGLKQKLQDKSDGNWKEDFFSQIESGNNG
jgi:hypothetical protein